MSDSLIAFERALARFPAAAADLLHALPDRRGVIPAAEARRLGELLAADRHRLMLALLPVAAAFAHTPISAFPVGAVAAGREAPDGSTALYLGANFEVEGESTGLSIHAEQAAVTLAWVAGETGLSALAASSIPCGHCRQFLYELEDARSLPILRPAAQPPGHVAATLGDLLPDAFGPHDLGVTSGFLAGRGGAPQLAIAGPLDALAAAALQAARLSYAPYSGAFAGCALQFADGTVLTGRCIENAAHNPGLAAVQAALAVSNASRLRGELAMIRRAVLVEHATTSSEAALTERCVQALAPLAVFEHRRAAPATVA